MDIVIVGAGNVAGFLGPLLQEHGHRIRQVMGKNEARARSLAGRLGCSWVRRPAALDPGADLYLLAVTDQALPLLNAELRLGERPAVHTAGAVPLAAISAVSAHTGVFYPLQTIREGTVVQGGFPVLVEATAPAVSQTLRTLGQSLGLQVVDMNSAERLKMHLAAVFCNNFPNHLAVLCQSYCREESLDFSLLGALLQQTFARILAGDAAAAQTGPAVRGDHATMEKHLALLEAQPEMRKIYALLSASIEAYHRKQYLQQL